MDDLQNITFDWGYHALLYPVQFHVDNFLRILPEEIVREASDIRVPNCDQHDIATTVFAAHDVFLVRQRGPRECPLAPTTRTLKYNSFERPDFHRGTYTRHFSKFVHTSSSPSGITNL